MTVERPEDETTLTHLQTRLRRVERQNRVLIGLVCSALAIASLGVATAAPNILSADEARTHRISLLDPTGAVVGSWYSDTPGSFNHP
ncbi:MAG TPA: hypothetical protein VN808_13010 [Stellaceae bacterium]|nr:hypothetical protein [Stellaceae bacterium]